MNAPSDCSKLSRGSQNDLKGGIVRGVNDNLKSQKYLIAKTKLILRQFHTTAQTFCYTETFFVQLPSELKRDSTKPRAALFVNP